MVAGWGYTRNTDCHTNFNGPAPNTKCTFPFVHKAKVYQDCAFDSTPMAEDETCKVCAAYNCNA